MGRHGSAHGARPLGATAIRGRPIVLQIGEITAGPRTRTVALALGAALLVPLIVSVVALREPRWYPSLDWAQLELRVRDVGGSHTPLVGLPGRFEGLGARGSHPGPLAFYALAPAYRLFGSSAWALSVATATLNAIGVAVAMWIAKRRGGWLLTAGVVAVLALLANGYGVQRLAVPWNPWLPIVWWVVFLLASWSVVCRDHAQLLVAAAAGSFCAQTHIPYLPLVAGALALLMILTVTRLRDQGEQPRRWSPGSWTLAAVGVLFATWLPPLMDEVVHEYGNLSVLRAHFVDAVEPAVGFGGSVRASLAHLDLTSLVVGEQRTAGGTVPGLLLVFMWASSLGWSVRHRCRELIALHVVVGVAVLLGIVAVSRVLGPLWSYLLLWQWGTTALMALAIVGTAVAALQPSRRLVEGICIAVTIACVVPTTFDATQVEPALPGLSRELAALMPETVSKLDRSGRYFIGSDDPYHIANAQFSLLLELERAGIDAGMTHEYVVEARPSGVVHDTFARSQIVFAAGDEAISRWRALHGLVELAHFEPSARERAAAERGFVEIERSLGQDRRLKRKLRSNLFGFAVDPDVPSPLRRKAEELLDTPFPASTFLLPPRLAWDR